MCDWLARLGWEAAWACSLAPPHPQSHAELWPASQAAGRLSFDSLSYVKRKQQTFGSSKNLSGRRSRSNLSSLQKMKIIRVNSKQSSEFLYPRWTVAFRVTATLLKISSSWWQVIQHWAKLFAFDFFFSPIIRIRLYFYQFTLTFTVCPHPFLLAFTRAFCIFPSHQLYTSLNLIRISSPSYMSPNNLTQFIPYNLSNKWMFV